MEVVKSHGCICLTGPSISQIADEALTCLQKSDTDSTASSSRQSTPSLKQTATCSAAAPMDTTQPATVPKLDNCTAQSTPHVTLVTKEELAARTISRPDLLKAFQLLDPAAFFPAGVLCIIIPMLYCAVCMLLPSSTACTMLHCFHYVVLLLPCCTARCTERHA